MKINLLLSAKQNKEISANEILIRLIVNHSQMLRAKSGIYADPEDWSDTKGGLKTISKVAPLKKQRRINEINAKIDNLKKTITESFTNTPIESINKEWLEKVIHDFHFPPQKEPKTLSFFEVFDLFLAKTEKENALATKKKFKTLKRHLVEFEPDLAFEDIDKNTLDSFVEFMQTAPKQKDIDKLEDKRQARKAYKNSSMTKEINLLKWFLSWALANGYNTNTAFKLYKPKFKTPKKLVIFLDKQELESVVSHDFSNNKRLDQVRDVFVFCCYSGLRYSDVENLKRSNIYDDKIHITTIKTADSITINLNNMTRSILEKYKDCQFEDNKALPVLSNQKMNDALKEMAEACELNSSITITYYIGAKRYDETHPKHELISTHAGRRTFICTALSLGIAPQVVMKWTGHSDYQSMKPYIDITEKAKADAMDLFNK